MAHPPLLLHHSPSGRAVPEAVREFARRKAFALLEIASPEEVLDRLSRAYPQAVVLDASDAQASVLRLCEQLKAEASTAVVPVIAYVEHGAGDAASAALEAGADEVLSGTSERERSLRLELALRRAHRDVSVHPTTRLPGTVEIERDFARRISSGRRFAVCYVDLDHFKEFNDRYGYHHGDRIILIVSRILRDIVRAHSADGFVGHIGGDDFIFSVPLEDYRRCCEDVIEVFDTLIPLQYDPADRERGWFVGKDRRGQQYEVPLMTISIGVITNEARDLRHPGQISALATEMKAYAKTFPGSVYVPDRRSDEPNSERAR